MFKQDTNSRRLLSMVAVILLSVCLGGCWFDDDGSEPDPSTGVEQYTRTVEWRNAEKDNGEISRTKATDSKGRVREIEVGYHTGQPYQHGLIKKDVKGNITSLAMTLTDTTVVTGRLSADSNTLLEGSHKRADGRNILTVEPKGADTQIITLYQFDGQTVQAVGTQTAAGTIWHIMGKDGKSVAAELKYEGGSRTYLKLFDEDGKVKFQDSRGTDSPYYPTYVGIVYDKQGKPTHRVAISESAWSAGAGTLKKVEVFDTDGVTVKTSTDVQYWNPQPIPLGVFANQQELMAAKGEAISPVTTANTDIANAVKALNALLKP